MKGALVKQKEKILLMGNEYQQSQPYIFTQMKGKTSPFGYHKKQEKPMSLFSFKPKQSKSYDYESNINTRENVCILKSVTNLKV